MCGRFALFSSPASIVDHLHLDSVQLPAGFTPRYNIAPGQEILVIRNNQQPALLRWGLIPGWAKDEKIGYRLINARAETLWEKPAFRRAASARRCLIPADLFYEWEKTADGKQPYAIRMKTGRLFAMAGVWDAWTDRNTGEVIESCTIITTAAVGSLKKIHGRMPLIVPPEHYAVWVESADYPNVDFQNLLKVSTTFAFELTPVGRRLNRPENDDPTILEPANR
ncbi:MAG: hypothetical protein DRH04_03580 [Deltaproteobacteria bacterium]|nr:MAG: hypothetical protein DRH04_03580 [Deltaproteobacteria bacterium]